jgi:DNA-binding CsgD family transcriptional regulator/tetratricopeptide (TPR) repeat protein
MSRPPSSAAPFVSPPSRSSPHPFLPLTGRGAELATLAAALSAAEQGRGSSVFLGGESGVGKTRLVAALTEQAAQRGFVVAMGRAYPVETGVPYAVLSDALVPVLRGLESGVLSLLTRGGTAELMQLFPALSSAEKAASPVRGDPAELKARLLWNFAQFLSRFSAKRPLLVVLENLQWADASSLELLHFVARQIGTDRLLLVGTHNDTDSRVSEMLRSTQSSLEALGAARSLSLTPLDERTTIELVERTFHVESERVHAFGVLLYRWTRGNPFFIEETLKALVESGRLHERQGQWTGWDVAEFTPPRSVREAVQARLTSLSEDARRVADFAAVIGTRASHDALATVSGIEGERLLLALDELRRARVLVESTDDRDIIYDFSHPLLQDTIYSALGLARARMLHASVAEALEEFYGSRALEHADELAFHYVRSDARRLAGKAVRYLRGAGRIAMAKHANKEAADYLSTALELTARSDDAEGGVTSAEIIPDLARTRQRLGEYDAALRLWEQAIATAEARGALGDAASIRRSMGLACFWTGRYTEALAHYDAGLSSALEADAPTLRARLQIAKGMCLQALGRRNEAEAEVERALEIAQRIDDVTLMARIHRALLLLYVWTGPAEPAREHGRKAIELAERSNQRGVAWSAHWALAMLGGLTGDAPAVSRHLSEAQRLAEELRSPLLRVWTAEVAIEYAAGVGDWDNAVALAEKTITMARALGQRTLLPRVLVWLGLLYFGRGEIERGKACVDEAWHLSGADNESADAKDVHTVVPAHTGRAAYHLTMKEYAKAILVGERGLRIADRSGYIVWAVHRLMPVIAEAALWASDMERARQLSARMRRDSELLGHKLGPAWADACDALVEMLKGDKQRSVALLRSAAESLEAIPFVPDAARVRRQLGRALIETGDTEGAIRELRRVHEVFAHLGAEPELDGTREQLRVLGSRPPQRSVTAGVAGLTGRELEIVRLVAARRSNKEIGAALDISSRTVSTHVSNIFAKLGVASRGELTDYARKNGLVVE